MPFSRRTLEEKPYNRCINCAHIGQMCDGPNFLAMEIERWCEWCHLRKEYLGWTNAHVAEVAGVSKISVDRIMAVNIKDLRISTMQAVTKALVNGTWGKYPCVMAATGSLESTAAECTKLNEKIAAMQAEHKTEVEAIRAEEGRKIEYLREQLRFANDQIATKDRLLESITRMFDVGRK